MKYELKICSCGRIHMIPEEKLTKAFEDEKELLVICGGCGMATAYGADIVPDYADIVPDYADETKKAFELYSNDVRNANITDMGKYSEIIIDEGIKVPMMTGEYASAFDMYGYRFSDMIYPDFYKIERDNVTAKEVLEFFDEWKRDRTTVNMDRLISENQDKEDMLEELSHYSISGLDWRNTKYAVSK